MAHEDQPARSWLLLLPRQVRDLPGDLAAVFSFVALANLAVVLPVVRNSPVRVALGLPFVLFVPGYALIAALFPEAGGSPAESAGENGDIEEKSANDWSEIDGIERITLSFGLSIVVVPLVGLVLNFTPWGTRMVPVMLSVNGVTAVAAAAAARRRWALPKDERFTVPYRTWVAAGRRELFEPDSRADAALNVLLVASVLLAAGSVTYAVGVPKQGESFTEFYLLTEDEEGDLIADEYPTNVTVGESAPVAVGVRNREHRSQNYTVVVEIQQIQHTNNETIVQGAREIERFGVALDHNETSQRSVRITPMTAGQRVRVAFMLYRGSPPADPGLDSAYRWTSLYVNGNG
ncbi:DUF1616 domain-containing protein [Halosimplex rubrum]|uniref:DUF1616 domain-containing protein n=1 Tax=Halosimplex rubrum TaxID=869889 RepID=A0A7D5P3V4_9EURY|nr:DUF1616 domain-containing protein [Halosimplex rubrum]QLH76862.1 DUF1616 domain-containing protein [Halosimplex rubrum]